MIRKCRDTSMLESRKVLSRKAPFQTWQGFSVFLWNHVQKSPVDNIYYYSQSIIPAEVSAITCTKTHFNVLLYLDMFRYKAAIMLKNSAIFIVSTLVIPNQVTKRISDYLFHIQVFNPSNDFKNPGIIAFSNKFHALTVSHTTPSTFEAPLLSAPMKLSEHHFHEICYISYIHESVNLYLKCEWLKTRITTFGTHADSATISRQMKTAWSVGNLECQIKLFSLFENHLLVDKHIHTYMLYTFIYIYFFIFFR